MIMAPNAGSRQSARATRPDADVRAIWEILRQVPDPEIPVLTIVDLGIVRGVERNAGGHVEVALTPTYSGCPATEAIRALVRRALDEKGFEDARLREVLSPPWTSDWLTDEGREKLRRYGIAPPAHAADSIRAMLRPREIACPRCDSVATERVSEFGSTPCKAHYRCRSCLEPFDYFKCI
jgi:ring-1,2-phenylacetyl-CoA epoxidase subunit PaaD